MTASADRAVPPRPADVPSHRALEQAAEWFALLRSGEAGEADRAAWQSWLDASEEHRAASAYVERVSARFEPIRRSADPRSTVGVLNAAHDRRAVRRQLLLSVAALAGSGAAGWMLWRDGALPALVAAWTADHATGVGEVRRVALADGTRVWLGSASAFDEDYRADLRRLRLRTGEIFIETAADAARPFVIDTPHGRLRALGTRFDVRLENGRLEDGRPGDGRRSAVAVYEGAVEVRTAATDATVVLRAGQQTRFGGTSVDAPAAAEPGREAWIRGVLIAQDLPLAEVVAELGRYRHGHLGVAPEVAGLRVHGSFPLGDTDRALSMLAGVLPIVVRRPLPWWSSVEPREPAGR